MDKNQKKIIKVLLIIFIILLIGILVLYFNKDNIKRSGNFIVPEYEKSLVDGKPENIEKDLTYKEMSVKDDYVVYVCATPKEKDGILTLYFTSSDKNVDLFKIRVYDTNNNLLGESGLLKPNSYVKDITLNRSLEKKEMISIKVMAYEKETYYSKGSIKLNVLANN